MAAKSAPDFGRPTRLRLALAVIVLAVLGLGLRQARTAALAPTVPDPVAPPPHSLLPRPILAPAGHTCPLCQPDPSMPIVQMTPADAESLGRAYATFNEALLARTDSLLQSGAFGDPERAASRRTAHLLTRILAVNSLHYMVGFPSAPDRIYEASEPTLRDAFEHYSDPGVYGLAITRLPPTSAGC